MNKNAELFADTLINLILKTKLYDQLDSKELKKFQFNFALVTGIADASKKIIRYLFFLLLYCH